MPGHLRFDGVIPVRVVVIEGYNCAIVVRPEGIAGRRSGAPARWALEAAKASRLEEWKATSYDLRLQGFLHLDLENTRIGFSR